MIYESECGKSAHGELEAKEHHDQRGETARPCPCVGSGGKPFDGVEAWDGGNAEDQHIEPAKPRGLGGDCGDEGCEDQAAGEKSPQETEQVRA